MLSIIIHRRHHTVTAMAGKLGTAARRVTRCRAAIVRRIEVPAEADGVLGTAVRRATPSKAVVVRPIKVRSADRRAEGMATELTRTRVQRYAVVGLSRRILPRKLPASDVVPADVAVTVLIAAIETWSLAALRRTMRFRYIAATCSSGMR
jgi:hypothetical protein